MKLLVLIFSFYVTIVSAQYECDSLFEFYKDFEVEYFNGTDDPFKKYYDKELIVDYYNSWGISTGERFWYEIIVVDSSIIFNFKSPETFSFSYINYQYRMILETSDISELKTIIEKSSLKQTKFGFPDPDASMHEKEIL